MLILCSSKEIKNSIIPSSSGLTRGSIPWLVLIEKRLNMPKKIVFKYFSNKNFMKNGWIPGSSPRMREGPILIYLKQFFNIEFGI